MKIKKYYSKRIGNIAIQCDENQVTMYSARLELRSLNQDDEARIIEHYSALLGDKDNVALFIKGSIWEKEQVTQFIQTEREQWNSGERFHAFAIYDRQSKLFMGSLYTIHCADDFAEMGEEYENVVEIGYVFDKAFWGKGYGTEAAILGKKYIKQVIDEAAQDSSLNEIKKIVATAHPDNAGSKNILLKTLKHQEPGEIRRYGQPRELFFKPLKKEDVQDLEPNDSLALLAD